MTEKPTARTFTFTYLSLMGLLVLTFAAARVNLGPLNTAVGLIIAAAKALLVVLFFMQIRYSRGITRILACAGVFWLGILLTLTLSDYLTRGWLFLPGQWP